MRKDALFEIGLEELPARFIDDAEQQFHKAAIKFLKDERLAFESVESYATPRRLAVIIRGLADAQTSIEEEMKGPAVKIAKDDNGDWTKAAVGFTKGQGLSVEDIYIKELKGTEYIFVNKHIKGLPAMERLSGFADLIQSIQFNKNMRWADQSMRYARPIRWLVALYGNDVVPFEIAGVRTGRMTFGHRFLGGEIELKEPKEYLPSLTDQYVIASPKEREEMIVRQIHHVETTEGYEIPVDQALLEEVRNLVEYPTVFMGRFEDTFLKLPSDILVTSMKAHQRYFPVKDSDGHLLPMFVGVRNGDERALETVVKGNEKVLKARLADAQFFYEEDQKTPLKDHLEKLSRVVFQEKLGTLEDKVMRIKQIAGRICDMIALSPNTKDHIERAAEICKFDLMTQMVNEFTELEGIMGEDYALKYGESPHVANAIREHYLPKSSQGELPQTVEGAVLSIADKLDTVTGSLSLGRRPSASQDPYGLRRQATGILRILESRKWDVSVEDLLQVVMRIYDETVKNINWSADTFNEVQAFFKTRAEYVLRDEQVEQDIVHAVISNRIGNYSYAADKAHALSSKRHDQNFKPTQEALVRVLNIAKKAEQTIIEPAVFQTDSERTLYEAFEDIKPKYQTAKSSLKAQNALDQLEKLAAPIHAFFEHNMVMAEDEEIRLNRLALMHAISELVFDYADLSVVEWKQHF
ncbi:Glycine--tRNA ligase [Lentibacillus sp. JNUCC-1]|uniref:glycine--tRNA ligase subunit beta n=1 Tax=Lentibacillus sp. JNUCC-1 TaxID=2654513 RepID=UPI0012E81A6F|nr:glycine--tRNA ligase subunit beta [Lentibacillus sp. JNUCC-1]MUV39610.1 Glycine--tRNA ligase [Lentibacillus sp. JNUCC-1]